jgi:hypothetical protein
MAMRIMPASSVTKIWRARAGAFCAPPSFSDICMSWSRLPYRQRYGRHRPCCSAGNGDRQPNRCGAATWRQRIVIGRRRIQRQDFAVRRHLHMFHLAFSTGGEHASAAFHSIAHAQSRGFEPRWPSIEDEVEPSLRIEHILRAIITYLTWTADGLQRHTVYIGLLADKPAEEVRREANAETRSRWRRPLLQLRPRGAPSG